MNTLLEMIIPNFTAVEIEECRAVSAAVTSAEGVDQRFNMIAFDR